MKKDINQQLRDLNSYESKLDTDRLWTKLEPQLPTSTPEKKKRKPLAYWWLVAGAVAILVFGLSYNTLKIKTAGVSDALISVPIEKENQTIKPKTSMEVKPLLAQTPLKNQPSETAMAALPTLKDGQSEASGPTVWQQTTTPPNIGEKTSDHGHLKKYNLAEMALELNPHLPTSPSEIQPIVPARAMITPHYLPLLSLLQISIAPAVLHGPITPNPYSKRTYWHLGIVTGYHFLSQSLSYKDGYEPSAPEIASNATPLDAWSTSLYLKKQLSKKIGIRIGLQYTKMTERFNHSNSRQWQDTVYTVTSRQINFIGDTIAHMGYRQINQEEQRQVMHFNRYHLIDIPLQFSYDLQYGKWYTTVFGGPILNIGLKASGKTLNAAEEVVPIKSSDYRPSIGLGYQFEAMTYIPISNKWMAQIGPAIRGYDSSFTGNDAAIKKHYVFFGINAGVQYQF